MESGIRLLAAAILYIALAGCASDGTSAYHVPHDCDRYLRPSARDSYGTVPSTPAMPVDCVHRIESSSD